MTLFHAVLLDETRCEHGVSVEAPNKAKAYEILARNYPESRCVQLESPEDTAAREEAMYRRANDELDGIFYKDDEGEY